MKEDFVENALDPDNYDEDYVDTDIAVEADFNEAPLLKKAVSMERLCQRLWIITIPNPRSCMACERTTCHCTVHTRSTRMLTLLGEIYIFKQAIKMIEEQEGH